MQPYLGDDQRPTRVHRHRKLFQMPQNIYLFFGWRMASSGRVPGGIAFLEYHGDRPVDPI